MLVFHVVYFALDRLDEFIVGRLLGTEAIGGYCVAAYIGTMPANEVSQPFGRALFPSYVNDPPRLVESYLKTLGFVAVVCVSICLGMVAVSQDLIHVFLGERWLYIVPIFNYLAPFAGVAGICSSIGVVMMAVDRFKPFVILTISHLVILAIAVVGFSKVWGLEGVAFGRLLAVLLILPPTFFALRSAVPITFAQIGAVIWRPLVAGAIMYGTVRALHLDHIDIPAVTLARDVAVGVVTFSTAIPLLWIAQGRPDGAERVMTDYILAFLRRVKGKLND